MLLSIKKFIIFFIAEVHGNRCLWQFAVLKMRLMPYDTKERDREVQMHR